MSLERFSLAGKVAIVTGAGRGIGRAIALGLADAGADVVVMARTAEQVQTVAGEVAAAGRRGLAIAGDVSRAEDINRCVAETLASFGQLDILVNNAGIASSAPLRSLDLEEWNRLMSVNATGTFLCTRAFLPGMIAGGWGRVINVASVAGRAGSAYISGYAASKHAVIGLMRTVAKEAAPRRIRVNVIAPGPIANAFQKNVEAGLTAAIGQDATAFLNAHIPLGRHGRAEEIARAVMFLASDQSSFTTGSVLMADGGMHV